MANRSIACAVVFQALFLMSVLSSAEAVTIQDLQTKMEESSLRFEGLECRYVHEMRSSLTNESVQSSGALYFKKPNLFRVEQKEPDEQRIVTQGKYIYIYKLKFKQVLRDSLDHWLKNNFLFHTLSSFSENLKQLEHDYEWKIEEPSEVDAANLIQVLLTKTKSASQKEPEFLRLWIDPTDYLPRKSEWSFGSLKLITTFSELKLDPLFAKDLFHFKKPADAKIIHLD